VSRTLAGFEGPYPNSGDHNRQAWNPTIRCKSKTYYARYRDGNRIVVEVPPQPASGLFAKTPKMPKTIGSNVYSEAMLAAPASTLTAEEGALWRRRAHPVGGSAALESATSLIDLPVATPALGPPLLTGRSRRNDGRPGADALAPPLRSPGRQDEQASVRLIGDQRVYVHQRSTCIWGSAQVHTGANAPVGVYSPAPSTEGPSTWEYGGQACSNRRPPVPFFDLPQTQNLSSNRFVVVTVRVVRRRLD
jgi:hypothetical protein